MKFSDETIDVLKNFSGINNSILFREGNVIKTISPQKDIFAAAEIEESIDRNFSIYNLNRFLGVLGLFNDPEINLEPNQAVISTKSSKLTYTYADPSTFVVAPEKEFKFPTSKIEFVLKAEDLQKVMKAGGVLQLPEIAFVGDGETLSLKAYDQKNPTTDSFSVDIGETDEVFTAIFKADNLRMIPNDYEVKIAKGISKFSSKKIQYYVATESTSKFSD